MNKLFNVEFSITIPIAARDRMGAIRTLRNVFEMHPWSHEIGMEEAQVDAYECNSPTKLPSGWDASMPLYNEFDHDGVTAGEVLNNKKQKRNECVNDFLEGLSEIYDKETLDKIASSLNSLP